MDFNYLILLVLTTAQLCAASSNNVAKQTCPGNCNRKTAKKFYLMGETGVGKSTMANVLSGQQPSTGCFESKNSMIAVTKTTYDHGCFPLVDGSYGTDVILVDTPGLNDVGKNDIYNLMSMEKYHNGKLSSGDTPPSAFMFLLKDGRFEGALRTMLENLAKAFGPTFFKHVLFCFVRMPFTEQNVYVDWATEDWDAQDKGQEEIYGENLEAHRKRWGKKFHQEAVTEEKVKKNNIFELINFWFLIFCSTYFNFFYNLRRFLKKYQIRRRR